MEMKKNGRPRKLPGEKCLPSDRIKCPICPASFNRNNRSTHYKTKQHQLYLNIEQKLLRVIKNEIEPKETKTMVEAIILDNAIKDIRERLAPSKKKVKITLFDSDEE